MKAELASRPARRPQVRLTARDYYDLPQGPPYFQLIEGRLHMSPSPEGSHQDITGNVFFIIRQHLKKHPLGKVRTAPSDVEFDAYNVYQPDVYFIPRSRFQLLSKQGAQGAPALVVEVLSKSTARLDKGPKLKLYAQEGVEEYWIVDQEARAVTVYRFAESVDEPIAVYSGEQKFTTPVLPGLKISLAEIFEE